MATTAIGIHMYLRKYRKKVLTDSISRSPTDGFLAAFSLYNRRAKNASALPYLPLFVQISDSLLL